MLMAVVKAEAYGHGMLRVASELLSEGADYLGVALIEEAVALREAGISAPILVFGSPLDDRMPLFARLGVDLAVTSAAKARAAYAAAAAEGKVIRAHLKIDTGMGRMALDGTSSTASPRRFLVSPLARGSPAWNSSAPSPTSPPRIATSTSPACRQHASARRSTPSRAEDSSRR